MTNYNGMKLEAGLKKLEGDLVMTYNDSAVDLVRKAREEIWGLRAIVRDVRLMATSGQLKRWEGEPWILRVANIDLES